MEELYFDEIINVNEIDQKVVYDKVCRIKAKNEEEDFYLELDIHSELYPIKPAEKYRMIISNSLVVNSSEGKQILLADKFEYVMHGLLYKMTEDIEVSGKVVIYISFGGLQLMLKGDPLKMHKFTVDKKMFLLLRKM